jgi:hypothetical protein
MDVVRDRRTGQDLDDAYVCPYLLGIEKTQVTGPLAEFQMTVANPEETRALMQTLNRALVAGLDDERLSRLFDRAWPDLSKALEQTMRETENATPAPRPQAELVDKVLTRVRAMEGRLDGLVIASTRPAWNVNPQEILSQLRDALERTNRPRDVQRRIVTDVAEYLSTVHGVGFTEILRDVFEPAKGRSRTVYGRWLGEFKTRFDAAVAMINPRPQEELLSELEDEYYTLQRAGYPGPLPPVEGIRGWIESRIKK